MLKIDERLSNKLANMSIVSAMLVCCIHSPGAVWYREVFIAWLCRIAVPYFFFCSGLFLAGHMDEDGWWRRETGKRVSSLFIPYVSWSLIFLVFSLSLKFVANVVHQEPWYRNIPVGWQNLRWLGLDPFVYPEYGVLWFVRALFILVLVSPVIKIIADSGLRWLWTMACWLAGLVVGVDCWLNNLLPLFAVAFFSAGVTVRRHPFNMPRVVKVCVVVIAIIGSVWILTRCVALQYPQQTLSAKAALPFILYSVWMLVPACKWTKWLTSVAFGVYLLHGFVAIILGMALPSLPYPISCAIVIAVTIVIINLCKRYLPWTKRWLFGGR